jgi:5-methylcytosine-specific restriction enzyme subunit McrC
MNQISLVERRTYSYKELGWTPDDPILGQLENLNVTIGADLLDLGRHSIRVKQYVGVIRVGNLTLELLPKIDYGLDTTNITDKIIESQSARRNLLHILSYAMDLPLLGHNISSLDTQKSNWSELLIRLFAADLHQLMKQGLEHSYQRIEDTIPVLRGKWQIQRQITQHSHIRHQFDVVYEEFTPDTPLNRIFRYIVNRLLLLSRDSLNVTLLRDLDIWLARVEHLKTVTPGDLLQVHFTRLNERFRLSYNLAKLFLEDGALKLAAGGQQAFAFVFDMDDLFEKFVARFIRRYREEIFPVEYREMVIRIQAEGKRSHLVKKVSDDLELFQLKPDIMLMPALGDLPVLILDTKYKRLKLQPAHLGLAENDLYQMVAYATRFNCKNVLLIYPQPLDTPPVLQSFKVIAQDITIHVGTVNLHQPLEKPANLIKDMRVLFASLLTEKI